MSQTHPEGRAFLLLQAEAWEVCVGTGEAHGGQALHLHPAPYLCHLHQPAQVGVSGPLRWAPLFPPQPLTFLLGGAGEAQARSAGQQQLRGWGPRGRWG